MVVLVALEVSPYLRGGPVFLGGALLGGYPASLVQISQAKPSEASHAIQENSQVKEVEPRKSTHVNQSC